MPQTIEKARTVLRGDRDGLGVLVRRLSDTLTVRGQRSFRNAVLDAVSGDASSGWNDLTIHTSELFDIYETAFKRAGRAESAILGQFDIDLTHPRVVRHLQTRSATLVAQTDEQTKNAIRTVLGRGARSGMEPEQLVARIRRVIGLTARDATAVENLRARLEIQGISKGRIERIARAYEKRLLDARALVIARTEVVDAIESARQELWEQAVEAGIVQRKNIWRVWVTAEDEKVCPICAPLDGARSRLGGKFRKGGQSALRPPAHPNCRCWVEYEISEFRVQKHGGNSHDQKDHGNWARGGSSIPGTNDVPDTYDPGTRPIPDGTIRMYHYTKGEGVVDSIARDGFRISEAKGSTYGEPNAMWFSTRIPEGGADFVEVAFPQDVIDMAIVGGIWKGSGEIALGLDVDKKYITAINKSWHTKFRYMNANPDVLRDVKNGEFDDFLNDRDYGPAIRRVKGIEKHYGPGPHPGTGSPQSIHGGGGGLPSTVHTKDGIIDTDWAAVSDEFWSKNEYDEDVESGLKNLRVLLSEADLWINVPPEVLARIAEDGFIYNQRRTQTSGGTLNNDVRDNLEEILFGPGSMSDTYPVYGYMAENPLLSAGEYGRAMIRLKSNVRANTTFTLGDSFGTGAAYWWEGAHLGIDGNSYPIPTFDDIKSLSGTSMKSASFIDNPTAGSADGLMTFLAGVDKPKPISIDSVSQAYTEAQIHQTVSLSDIDAIFVRESPTRVIPETVLGNQKEAKRVSDWYQSIATKIGVPIKMVPRFGERTMTPYKVFSP